MPERSRERLPLPLSMLLGVIAGAALVAVLWETLNELLAGTVRPGRLAVALPAALALAGVLALLARRIAAEPS